MLRVVSAPNGSQGEDPPKVRRRKSTALTDVERMRLRAALKHLRGLFGTWGCLAAAMGVPERTLSQVASSSERGSHSLAGKAAKAAGTTVERILGGLASADVCPTCGHSNRGGSA